MAETVLKALFYGLGLAAIGIGAGIFFTGPQAVAGFFAAVLAALFAGPFSVAPDSWPRDADNELRFYAVFWLAWGVCLVRAARDLAAWAKALPILIGLFFLGGVGRMVSQLQLGAPHPLFVVLMAVELALPPVMFALLRARRPQPGWSG